VSFIVLWHIDPLLGNEGETNKKETPLLGSGQRAKMEVLLEAVFSMNPLDRPSSVQLVQCSAVQWSGAS
jgi:hypothetical protein